jgi:hypothetical protein
VLDVGIRQLSRFSSRPVRRLMASRSKGRSMFIRLLRTMAIAVCGKSYVKLHFRRCEAVLFM